MTQMALQRVNLSYGGLRATFDGKTAKIIGLIVIGLLLYYAYQVYTKSTLNIRIG